MATTVLNASAASVISSRSIGTAGRPRGGGALSLPWSFADAKVHSRDRALCSSNGAGKVRMAQDTDQDGFQRQMPAGIQLQEPILPVGPRDEAGRHLKQQNRSPFIEVLAAIARWRSACMRRAVAANGVATG